MTTVLITEGHQLSLPPELRQAAPVGAQFQVTVDQAGRIILTPENRVQAILQETFGMWSDRDELPADGVDYVNEIRPGYRLDEVNAGETD